MQKLLDFYHMTTQVKILPSVEPNIDQFQG